MSRKTLVAALASLGLLATSIAAHAQQVKPGVVPLIGGGNVVLDVSPASGSTTATGSSSSQTYVFYVENTGTANGTGTFSISSCTGAVSSCTLSPTSASVRHGGSVPVTVTFHTAATGTGSIMLTVFPSLPICVRH